MAENGITVAEHVEKFVVELEESAKTGILVAYDNDLIGVLGIADPLKREAAVVIEGLKKMDIVPVMVTGDNWRTARAVAKEVLYHVVGVKMVSCEDTWGPLSIMVSQTLIVCGSPCVLTRDFVVGVF